MIQTRLVVYCIESVSEHKLIPVYSGDISCMLSQPTLWKLIRENRRLLVSFGSISVHVTLLDSFSFLQQYHSILAFPRES